MSKGIPKLMSSIKFNLISNNVKGILLSSHIKRDYKSSSILKIKVVPMTFHFSKKYIPRRKIKLDGIMILVVTGIIPMANLIHAMFLFRSIMYTVRKSV